MNARQFIAIGFIAAVSGFGPATASAQDAQGSYFGVLFGYQTTDLSIGDLNAIATSVTHILGGTTPTGTSDLRKGEDTWGAQIGYRFNRWVAAEIGYVNLGKSQYVATLTSDFGAGAEMYDVRGRWLSTGPTLSVLGIIPIGPYLEVYGRGGVYFADTRFRIRVEFFDQSFSHEEKAGSQELFFGLGGAWNIGDSYALRLEGTHFVDVGNNRTEEASITMVSVGFLFR